MSVRLWKMRFSLRERRGMRVAALGEWAGITSGERVLDIGAGKSPIVADAKTVDLEEPASFVADMDAWDTDEKFDVVVFADSLYYSRNPLELLKKTRRWLSSGGRLIISVFAPEIKPATPALYCWNERTLENILSAAGFRKFRFTRFKIPVVYAPVFTRRIGRRIFCEARP